MPRIEPLHPPYPAAVDQSLRRWMSPDVPHEPLTLFRVLHRNPDTYRYIPASIRRYPGAGGVVDLLRSAGFSSAAWTRVLGGLMAIHVARR